MKNHILLVTGSGRGIGAATALLAAKAGYDVCINYSTDQASAEATAAACRAEGVQALVVQADIAHEHELSACLPRVMRDLDRLAIW